MFNLWSCYANRFRPVQYTNLDFWHDAIPANQRKLQSKLMKSRSGSHSNEICLDRTAGNCPDFHTHNSTPNMYCR